MKVTQIGMLLAGLALCFPPVAAEEARPPAGTARLNCSVVTDGALSNCVLATETPRRQGFGARALELAKTTKVEARASAVEGVIVPFNFEAPSQPSPPLAQTVGWIMRPTAAQLRAAYPERAATHGISGFARIWCDVKEDGYVENCKVTEETPRGEGFGTAALSLAKFLKLKPRVENGAPIRGTVGVPFTFRQ